MASLEERAVMVVHKCERNDVPSEYVKSKITACGSLAHITIKYLV